MVYSAYLLTFSCYGSWLPGQSGAANRTQNQFGSRWPEPNASTELRAKQRMKQEPYRMDAFRRKILLEALQDACLRHGWVLLAAHIRSNHVHAVVASGETAEHVMTVLKARASVALNKLELDGPKRRRWARHGSTRYLWTKESISAAIRYVICEQGEPMAVFEMPLA